MLEPLVVIVTDFFDPHADAIIKRLSDAGHEPVRVNTTDLPLDATFVARLDDAGWAGGLRIESNGRRCSWSDVTAVWWRRPGEFGLSESLTDWEREFANEELQQATRGIFASLDCFWMSRPEDIARATYKIEQLQRARRFGFDVPATLVTTDPDAVREFAAECQAGLVYKVLSDPYLMARAAASKHGADAVEARFVPTTIMTPEMLENLDESGIRNAPCLFQEYIDKACEYRVTVIEDDLFVARIDSQGHDAARIDWRDTSVSTLSVAADRVPDDVAQRCHQFVTSYGLAFSALDLIRTPDGRFVFLENNPNGQFLFVEDRVPEMHLADAVASALVRTGNRA